MIFIHKTSIVDDNAILGKGTKVWHYSHILNGSIVGNNCIIGQNVMIGPNVTIGDGCKIQNNVSIYEGVELGNNVFCGPSCVFTNVINPRSFINRKKEFRITKVSDGATIGANATIICGVKVGKFSMIGAGAVVTKNVNDHAIVVGNPSKQSGWISSAGHKLNSKLICPITKEAFYLSNNKLKKK